MSTLWPEPTRTACARLPRVRVAAALGASLAALGLLAASAPAACPDEEIVPRPDNVARVKAAIVCLHNHERRAAGIPPLRAERRLARAASGHAADMVARRYFEHDAPDGRDPFQRIEKAGYMRGTDVWNAGENIAWATGPRATPRSVMDAWMASYGHRLTLLASEFSQLGVGVAFGAPSAEHAARPDAVTFVVDFGWRRGRSSRARGRPITGLPTHR